MPDDKTKVGKPDRSRVSADQDYDGGGNTPRKQALKDRSYVWLPEGNWRMVPARS